MRVHTQRGTYVHIVDDSGLASSKCMCRCRLQGLDNWSQ